MNTNNRIVGLQQHVVLLTVMEHAEDLIKIKKIEISMHSLRHVSVHPDHPQGAYADPC
jgi:hypothetical protein